MKYLIDINLLHFLHFILNINKEKIKEYGVESAFAILMIVTASAMAFAHGSNDVANAIGPM